MLKFEWNALRRGDHVSVHDTADPALPLSDGTVDAVDSRHGANRVGVRVTAGDGATTVVWPSYLTVHRVPRGNEPCWRCRSAATPATPA